MLGFDLRDEEDVINDLIKVGDIAKDYKDCRDKLSSLMILYNIDDMIKCDCRDCRRDLTFQERLHCPQCGGIGYIIKFKEKENEV